MEGPAQIRVVESGPARVRLEVKRLTENGIFTQQIRLAAGSGGDRVEIFNNIDWRSFAASLKADFTFTAANINASFEDKVGVAVRDNNKPTRFEMPLQQWMDLTDAGGGYGVEVMSDSKYGSDKPDDHTLRLTLLYTPGTRGGYRDQGTQDQGRHEILYAIAGHKGDWTEGRKAWQAARLNQPLRTFLPAAHTGNGRTFSRLTLNSELVQVEAVKKAEDSDEIIVRLKELAGKPAANLALRFPVAITAAREVNGQEQPIGQPIEEPVDAEPKQPDHHAGGERTSDGSDGGAEAATTGEVQIKEDAGRASVREDQAVVWLHAFFTQRSREGSV